MGSLHTMTPMFMGGIVIIWVRHGAKTLAKSLIVSNKNYCNPRAPMQWNGSLWLKILPSGKLDQFDTQEESMLVLLIICWNFEYVNSLSLRDTHRFKKQNIETPRTYRGIKEILLQLDHPRLIDWPNTGRRMISNPWLSMEYKCRPQLGLFKLKLLKIWDNFKYINSLTRRDTWYRYWQWVLS
jgi:hypothetical protein